MCWFSVFVMYDFPSLSAQLNASGRSSVAIDGRGEMMRSRTMPAALLLRSTAPNGAGGGKDREQSSGIEHDKRRGWSVGADELSAVS